ncbi:hypothetical protein [Nonomuraea insulae]|uniref:Uncharacterized protein n=1 Tax=Nonomuraea insulae TaxID=1616787 RepID=A0ABW1DER1_9ACTN
MSGTTGPENYLIALFDGAGAFWLALGVGALHAVAPGHGKSAAAAWMPALAGVAVAIGGCFYLATAITALTP